MCSRIQNCDSYQYDSNGGINCLICDPNFTVSNDNKHCTKGCNVNNCENCADVDGQHQCYFCKPGFIGIINPISTYYEACLSCDQFQCELLTEEAKQCCLSQLSQC